MNNNRLSGSQGQPMQAGLPNQSQHQSRSSYGINNGLPIPKGQGNGAGSRDRNGSVGQQAYDQGKSPPNLPNKSKSSQSRGIQQLMVSRYKACPLQVLQTRSVSSWYCLSFSTHYGSYVTPSALQVLHEGEFLSLCYDHC